MHIYINNIYAVSKIQNMYHIQTSRRKDKNLIKRKRCEHGTIELIFKAVTDRERAVLKILN